MTKDPFKIGISIGMLKGQKMYETNIEHPSHSFHEANNFIHDKFDPNFSIYFVDEHNRKRRGRRSRE